MLQEMPGASREPAVNRIGARDAGGDHMSAQHVELTQFLDFPLGGYMRGLLGFGQCTVDGERVEMLVALRDADGTLLVAPVASFEIPGVVKVALPEPVREFRIDDPKLLPATRELVVRLVAERAEREEGAK